MSGRVPAHLGVVELLNLAQRARMHASSFTHDDIGQRMLEFARELEARAEDLAVVEAGRATRSE